MHILLTGGTGLIGRALCQRWLADGHLLTVLSRRPQSVASLCGRTVRGIGEFSDYGDEPLDAIVNLAGEPIADRPWSNKRKAQLWGSRITLTEQMLEWLEKRGQRPRVLLNGSAVGWYGDGGERELTEDSPPVTDDFASQLCVAWEETALRAEAFGTRVVLVRTGLVLARDGGFLKRLVPPFRLGLGGALGNGRQWMSWVHLDDQIALMDFLLRRDDARGPYNACSPQPVRNRDFAHSLGRALGRPAFMPAPAFVLRLVLGELAGLLLGGQRAVPARLRAAGFDFAFTDLDTALGDLLKPKDVR